MEYTLVKSLHVISLISWMAGMLYLPRLYVYHCAATPGGEASDMLKIMERRLLRFIMNPAMILTFIFGIWLAALIGWENLRHQGWFHAKVTLVIAMTICHMFFSRWRRQFAADRNTHTAKFYRMMNEVPTVLMIMIVLLVIVKPF